MIGRPLRHLIFGNAASKSNAKDIRDWKGGEAGRGFPLNDVDEQVKVANRRHARRVQKRCLGEDLSTERKKGLNRKPARGEPTSSSFRRGEEAPYNGGCGRRSLRGVHPTCHTYTCTHSQPAYSIQPFRVSVRTTPTCVWYNNYLEWRASTTFAKCLHPLWSPHQARLDMLYDSLVRKIKSLVAARIARTTESGYLPYGI